MRLMTDMEIVWFQNVQMGQRKKLQRGVHHYTHHDVVRKYVFVIKRRKTTIKVNCIYSSVMLEFLLKKK